MKKIIPFSLTIFFLLLLIVPFSVITKFGSKPQESVVEARTLTAIQRASNPNLQRALAYLKQGNYKDSAVILLDLYTSSSFIKKFEIAINDQFPLRMPIIQLSKAIDRQLINVSYSLTKDTVIPADTTSDIYYDSVNNQLIFSPSLFNESKELIINERIQNYEELIESHPNLNFYLYYHQTLHYSESHPLNPVFVDADKGQSLKYFERNKPEGLQTKYFLIENMDDHLHYYYRTDHHWNINGVLRAYAEIYELLSNSYSQISPILQIDEIVEFRDINFLGRMARVTLYPIEGDFFAVEVVEFPSHKIIYSGQLIEENFRLAYFNGNYSMIPYTNHFNEFYGKVTDLIEYTFDNNADRNLLIIGSSFRNALDPLLASHYNKTYCVDFRYYTDFSLSDFLIDHDIDDVLIIGDNAVGFEDVEYWNINP